MALDVAVTLNHDVLHHDPVELLRIEDQDLVVAERVFLLDRCAKQATERCVLVIANERDQSVRAFERKDRVVDRVSAGIDDKRSSVLDLAERA